MHQSDAAAFTMQDYQWRDRMFMNGMHRKTLVYYAHLFTKLGATLPLFCFDAHTKQQLIDISSESTARATDGKVIKLYTTKGELIL